MSIIYWIIFVAWALGVIGYLMELSDTIGDAWTSATEESSILEMMLYSAMIIFIIANWPVIKLWFFITSFFEIFVQGKRRNQNGKNN